MTIRFNCLREINILARMRVLLLKCESLETNALLTQIVAELSYSAPLLIKWRIYPSFPPDLQTCFIYTFCEVGFFG